MAKKPKGPTPVEALKHRDPRTNIPTEELRDFIGRPPPCRQPEQIRAFRDTWKLGIHSYLAYLRDRLIVAREVLTESGSIFVRIGDENVHLVRAVMDEVCSGVRTSLV